MKNTEGQPKEELDEIYTSVGDVTHARTIDELPRGPHDLYYAGSQALKS